MRPSTRPQVVILGSGPNRIGQGIEFDYCCVHASFALRDAGYETVMVNCNPETVSTDYDTSDRLYFEPLTERGRAQRHRGRDAARRRAPSVIVALGGQTPLKLAGRLPRELVAGTSPESIDRAEDRERWNELCAALEIPQPPGGVAATWTRRWPSPSGSATPCSCGRATCSAAGPCGSCTTPDELSEAMAGARLGFGFGLGREGGLSAERPVLDRPLPGGRRRGRRRRHPRRHRRGAHRRGDGARRGGRRALGRLGLRHPAAHAACRWVVEVIEAYTRRHRRRPRRARPHQRAVRGRSRARCS